MKMLLVYKILLFFIKYLFKYYKLNILYIFILDMRKALSRDVKKKSVIPLTHPVRPEEID